MIKNILVILILSVSTAQAAGWYSVTYSNTTERGQISPWFWLSNPSNKYNGVYYTNGVAVDWSAPGAEIDPVFGAWKSTNTYVKTESDPIWGAVSNQVQTDIDNNASAIGANTTLIIATSNGVVVGYISADMVISNGVTTGYILGDTTVSNALQSQITPNTTHRTSAGTDHTYIDQDVRTSASPLFAGVNVKQVTDLPGGGIRITEAGSSDYWDIFLGELAGPNIDNFSVSRNGGTPKFIIEPSGNTGIGTTNAITKLDVAGVISTNGVPLDFTGGAVVDPLSFRAYVSSAQSVNDLTKTKVVFDGETFDAGSKYDPTTNYRYTPGVQGYYQINAQVQIAPDSGKWATLFLYKNGAQYSLGTKSAPYVSNDQGLLLADVVALGTTDYVEIYIEHTKGSAAPILVGSTNSNFSGFLVETF